MALQYLSIEAGPGLAVTLDVLIKAERRTYCQICSRVCSMNIASFCWVKASGPLLLNEKLGAPINHNVGDLCWTSFPQSCPLTSKDPERYF